MIGFIRRMLGHRDIDHGKYHNEAMEAHGLRMELRNARAREVAAVSRSVEASIDGIENLGVVEQTLRDAMLEVEGRKK